MKRLGYLLTILPLFAYGADVKISALPAGSTIAGTEEIPAVQSAATVKTTPAAIVTYANSATGTLTNKTLTAPVITGCTSGQVVYNNSTPTLTCSAGLQYDGVNTVIIGTGAGVLKGTDGTATGNGQNLTLRSGFGGATSGNAGSATIQSGTAADGNTGSFGALSPNATTTTAANRNSGGGTFQSGNGVNGGASGGMIFKSGNGGATGVSGSMAVTTGNGGTTSGVSGNWTGGTGTTTGSGSRSGNLTFSTGNATAAESGNITFNLGTSGTPVTCTAPGDCASFLFQRGTVDYVIWDRVGNFVFDPQPAFVSSSNDGFFWTPQASGVPTGTPTVYNSDYGNSAPLYVDEATMGLWSYDFANTRWVKTGNPTFSGTSASLGGGALLAGACASNTTTLTGAATTMVAHASPNTYPGDGATWSAQVTSANTVTTRVCAIVAITPTASTYNIRVLQ